MTLFCLQLDIVWENKPANHAKVLSLLENANPPKGALVLLPEMFATGFSMNVSAITDTPSGQSRGFLSAAAARFGVYLLAGLVSTGPDGRGQNQAVLFDPAGREIVCYHKLHPFTYGGESKHYASGPGLCLFSWAGFGVCPLICYDLRFPEVFRAAVRQGANLYAVIANWPAAREHHWLTLLQARAIENQAYVAAVNRCGSDPKLAYSGRSLIIDPRGQILADAGSVQGVIRADLDLPALQSYRRDFPALADMRPEFFR